MKNDNDRENTFIVSNHTDSSQIEVKPTPVDDINRLWGELTYDDIAKSLRELDISPSVFF